DGLESLASFLHEFAGPGKGRIDPRILPTIKAVHGTVNARNVFDLVRSSAIEDKGRCDLLVVRGETKCLPPAPTKTGGDDFSVGCGDPGGVGRDRVQVCGDLVRRERIDAFGGGVLPGKIARLPSARP